MRALIAGLIALVVGSGAADAGKRRVATLAPHGSPWMLLLEQGAEELRQKTEGRIDIQFYSGGVQGDESDVIRKMRLGQLDGAALTAVGLGHIYPGIRVLQLPFLFDSQAEVDYVLAKAWPYFQDKFHAKGYHLQTGGGAGWEHFYTRRKIATLDDLRAVKMWVWTDDPVAKAFFGELGLNTVPLGVPDLLGALKTGRVEGCYGPPLAAVALQWHGSVRNASTVPMTHTIGASVIRLEVWEQASEADRATETAAVERTTRAMQKRTNRDNARALRVMEKAGVALDPAPEPLVATLRAAAEKVWTRLAGQVYSQEELDMVLRYRAEFRAGKR